MRKLFTLLITLNFLITLQANTLTIGNFPAQAKGGQSVTGQIIETLVTTQPAAGVQFTIVTSPDATLVSVLASGGTLTAGKQIMCGPFQNSMLTCIAYGLNALTFGNATIATVTIQIAAKPAGSSLPVSLSSTLPTAPIEADAGGNAIAVIVGPPLAIGISSNCDVNSDGLVNAADVTAAARAELGLDPNPLGYSFFSVMKVIQAVMGAPCSL